MDYLKVCLSALFSAAALFLLTKLMGHKQLAQLDVFDYVNGITIGSIAAEMATEIENPIKPFIALLVYAVVAVTLSIVSNKLPSSRKIIVGHPIVLMDKDRLFRKNFKKAKLDINEFLCLCRGQGYFDINQIETAVFEHNGSLSILPKSGNRPLTPEDMKVYPPQEERITELIMDGKVIEENLKSIGKDDKWLKKQLEEQGVSDTENVFLAFADKKYTLTAYTVNE